MAANCGLLALLRTAAESSDLASSDLWNVVNSFDPSGWSVGLEWGILSWTDQCWSICTTVSDIDADISAGSNTFPVIRNEDGR